MAIMRQGKEIQLSSTLQMSVQLCEGIWRDTWGLQCYLYWMAMLHHQSKTIGAFFFFVQTYLWTLHWPKEDFFPNDVKSVLQRPAGHPWMAHLGITECISSSSAAVKDSDPQRQL